jgi:hypothetical protein
VFGTEKTIKEFKEGVKMRFPVLILTVLCLTFLSAENFATNATKEMRQIVIPQNTKPIGFPKTLENYSPARGAHSEVEACAKLCNEKTSILSDWGEDVLIDTSYIYDFDGDYDEENGWMWVALAPLTDSVVRLYRSTDHGLSWELCYTFWHTTRSLYSKVGVVVGRGDSNYVYIFARHSGVGNSGDICVFRVKFDVSGWDHYWMTWDADTINDFSVCRDYRSNYGLYCWYVNEQRVGSSNGKFRRSFDYGITWDEQSSNYVLDPNISAGATQFINAAIVCNFAGDRNQVRYLGNSNYGDPLYWNERVVSFDTFNHYKPKVAAAFTEPDSEATTWILYQYDWHNNGDMDIWYAVRSHAWADTWQVGYGLSMSSSFDEYSPDIKNYKSLGNPYVNAVFSMADSSWTDFVNNYWLYTNAGNPSSWSERQRINDSGTFVEGGWIDGSKIIYSPGAPASGGGVLYCRGGTWLFPYGLYFDAPWVGISEKSNDTKISKLLHSGPNPFRNVTLINYTVPKPSKVEIKIFDISGREVKTLVNKQSPSGTYSVSWDGTDNTGKRQGAGIYILKLKVNNSESVEKLILTK